MAFFNLSSASGYSFPSWDCLLADPGIHVSMACDVNLCVYREYINFSLSFMEVTFSAIFWALLLCFAIWCSPWFWLRSMFLRNFVLLNPALPALSSLEGRSLIAINFWPGLWSSPIFLKACPNCFWSGIFCLVSFWCILKLICIFSTKYLNCILCFKKLKFEYHFNRSCSV